MVLGEQDILTALGAIGVNPGDGLFVHTALGKIGHVIGGPRGLIQGLINSVGPTGLIGMPGFSSDAYDPVDMLGIELEPDVHARIRQQVPGFDPLRSNVNQNGAVAEAFRCWPGTVRSPHPTSSVLLFGPGAEEISHPHDPLGWPTGPDTPWGRLRLRPQMKILLIGVGWSRCSALHCAESAADYRRSVTRTIKSGPSHDAPWISAPDVADDLDRLFPLVGAEWERVGSVRTGKIGDADAKLTGYDEIVDFASKWISEKNRRDGVPLANS